MSPTISMRPPQLIRRTSLLSLLGLALFAASAVEAQENTAAQQGVTASLGAAATRVQLESLAVNCERLAADPRTRQSHRDALLARTADVRERLREGDFRVGDQLLIRVAGDSSLRGTFTVLPQRTIALPNMAEIPLQGVLRSELRHYLAEQIGRYVRDPRVTATPLIQIAVVGEVRTPGFYRIPAETPLSDVVMQAGGPTPAANLAATIVRRGTREVASARQVTEALASGATLDQLSLRAGDEIVVGQAKHFSVATLLQPVALLSGILVGIITLSARHR